MHWSRNMDMKWRESSKYTMTEVNSHSESLFLRLLNCWVGVSEIVEETSNGVQS